MQQVIVEISPAGSIKVDAQGFKGKGCEKATEQIEEGKQQLQTLTQENQQLKQDQSVERAKAVRELDRGAVLAPARKREVHRHRHLAGLGHIQKRLRAG